MASFSFFEILFVLLAGASTMPRDLVAFLDTDDYLRSRGVVVKVEQMTELAGKEPRDGKSQIGQLLAIRWLAEHPDEVKKAAGARAVLEAVAEGKKAQDPHGFAKEYARHALAKLDGKSLPTPQVGQEAGVDAALKWFPADVNFVAAADLHGSGPAVLLERHPLSSLLNRLVGPQGREAIYQFADAVGNFRLDRAALGLHLKDEAPHVERIYLRLTGAGNAEWLMAYLRKQMKDADLKEEKDSRGEPVRILASRKQAPAVALIGDTELIVASYQEDYANHLEVIRQVLDVRAGKKPNVLSGSLKELLKANASPGVALVAGELSEEVRQAVSSDKPPNQIMPKRFLITAANGKSASLHAVATFADEKEAKLFVVFFESNKEIASQAIQYPGENFRLPADVKKTLTTTINELHLERKGNTVTMTVKMPPETMKAIHALFDQMAKQIP